MELLYRGCTGLDSLILFQEPVRLTLVYNLEIYPLLEEMLSSLKLQQAAIQATITDMEDPC